MFNLEPAKKIQYIECDKGGFHEGQMLNMVCLESGCINNSTCCCACIEENHKKHETMSIKKMISDVREKEGKVSGSQNPQKFNTDILYNILDSSKKEAMEKFIVYKNIVRQNIVTVENMLKAYYGNVHSQLTQERKSDYSAAMQVLSGSYNTQELNLWMKKLVIHELSSQTLQPVTESDIISSIQAGHKNIMNQVVQKINVMGKQLQQMMFRLKEDLNEVNIWKPPQGYIFTPEFKANDIQILNETTVKSTSANTYKFAVMSPDIETGDFKEFKFHIKKKQSSWVAVGMCHRDLVKKNNFKFQYSALGHGAYMVSSNSGSWSNKTMDKNNKVMAFDFAQGDIITIQVNFSTKKIKFIRNDHVASYELQFNTIQGQKLYPCVLFYFNNDEVEYISKDN